MKHFQIITLRSDVARAGAALVINLAKSGRETAHYCRDEKGAAELKRRPNNHRSKHKDKRSRDVQKMKKQRDISEKKTDKYGVSILLDNDNS
jgi:hypothetical protein